MHNLYARIMFLRFTVKDFLRGLISIGLTLGCQRQRKMQSVTVSLSPGQIPWLQLLYSKSVRDLVQWSLCFLRDPQAISSTLTSLGMLQPQAFRSPNILRI